SNFDLAHVSARLLAEEGRRRRGGGRSGAECGDGVPGPSQAGAVDRQAVFQGQARVAIVELRGGPRVSLQPRGERRERVLEVIEEAEHLLARRRVFHHYEAHEMQPQVTRDRDTSTGV